MTLRNYSEGRSRTDVNSGGLSSDAKLIVILISDSVRMLDLAALTDAFEEADRAAAGGTHYKVSLVSTGTKHTRYDLSEPSALSANAVVSYSEFSGTADTLIVVGGNREVRQRFHEDFLIWFRKQSSQARRVASVSSGTMLLAETGLLDGRRAATHWMLQTHVAAAYPNIQLVKDVIYVRDGKFYTCAGATGAIDLALSFVEEDLGAGIASQVARSMLLYLRRPGAARQLSITLEAQSGESDRISELIAWLPGNLRQDLSVKNLAKRSAMSSRNFARLFKKRVGITPAEHVQNLRFEAAQRQLASGCSTLKIVADASGLANREKLRRLFIRRVNMAPEAYRAGRTQLSGVPE